jgi:transposase-like protein
MMTQRTDYKVQEGAEVTEGVRRTTGVTSISGHLKAPDPEVSQKQLRRKFTAQYKLRILEEADGCTEPGQIGALLRREGLYSSNLTTWRRQREQGQLQGLNPKKRGRKRKPKNPLADRVAQLEKNNRRLEQELKQARTIIEVQKKISDILGIPQPDIDEDGSNS